MPCMLQVVFTQSQVTNTGRYQQRCQARAQAADDDVSMHEMTMSICRTALPGKLTCRMSRCRSSSPISGNLVFTTDTRAAKTGVKVGEAIWDFIKLRQNRPLPRSRFCMP